MYFKAGVGFLVVLSLMSACGPNQFESSKNETTSAELIRAQSGLQLNVENRLPQVSGANGVPSVIHLNAEICASTHYENQDHSSASSNSGSSPQPHVSECYPLLGTIHSGESQSFLVPTGDLDRLYQVAQGRVKLRLLSSTQTTNMTQGCLETFILPPDYRNRKSVYQVKVISQNTMWGYQCQVEGQ